MPDSENAASPAAANGGTLIDLRVAVIGRSVVLTGSEERLSMPAQKWREGNSRASFDASATGGAAPPRRHFGCLAWPAREVPARQQAAVSLLTLYLSRLAWDPSSGIQ
jgi:hypothetical protein